jgi:hypothetical protein
MTIITIIGTREDLRLSLRDLIQLYGDIKLVDLVQILK